MFFFLFFFLYCVYFKHFTSDLKTRVYYLYECARVFLFILVHLFRVFLLSENTYFKQIHTLARFHTRKKKKKKKKIK